MATADKMRTDAHSGDTPARNQPNSATAPPPASPYRVITRHELRALVPYTPQHVLRLEKRGLFPVRIKIGPNRVGWLLSEVEAWLAQRIEGRDFPSSTD